jgi:hypothetical protein
LVHLFQSSSLLPSPLLMLTMASLSFLYLIPIQWTRQPHWSFLFPSLALPPLSWSPLSMTCVPQYCCMCFRSIIHMWGRTCSFWPCELD